MTDFDFDAAIKEIGEEKRSKSHRYLLIIIIVLIAVLAVSILVFNYYGKKWSVAEIRSSGSNRSLLPDSTPFGLGASGSHNGTQRSASQNTGPFGSSGSSGSGVPPALPNFP